MRFRSRHVHQTLKKYVTDTLTSQGWVNAPVNFCTTPVTVIGHMPLVEVPRMSPNPDVRILVKLEMVNPTGSVKDRVAKYLIEDLEERGGPGP